MDNQNDIFDFINDNDLRFHTCDFGERYRCGDNIFICIGNNIWISFHLHGGLSDSEDTGFNNNYLCGQCKNAGHPSNDEIFNYKNFLNNKDIDKDGDDNSNNDSDDD